MIGHPVITGIGVVSPVGIGKETFWKALIEKTSGIRSIGKFDNAYSYLPAAEVTDCAFEEFINDQEFRRVANISKYAIVAATLALKDAGLKELDGKRTSLIMGITHGAINMSREFHRGLVLEEGGSPILFSDSVLNAPAGNLSVHLGIKGGTHTLIGDAPTGIRVLGYAADLLKAGRIDLAIVGGAEELDEVVYWIYSKFGYASTDGNNGVSPFDINRKGFVMGEGAGIIVMERKIDALKRRARIYGEVGGWSLSNNIGKNALAKTMWRALDKASLNSDNIKFISCGANGNSMDEMEAEAIKEIFNKAFPFIGSIKPNIGEAFSATTLLQIISVCLMVEQGIITPNINLNSIHPAWYGLPIPLEAIETPIYAAMVNSFGIKEGYASIVIKRLEV